MASDMYLKISLNLKNHINMINVVREDLKLYTVRFFFYQKSKSTVQISSTDLHGNTLNISQNLCQFVKLFEKVRILTYMLDFSKV